MLTLYSGAAIDLVGAEARQSRRATLKGDAATVLANFNPRCHALIAAQLEIERGSVGGRPSNLEREFVLANLAIFFEGIFWGSPDLVCNRQVRETL